MAAITKFCLANDTNCVYNKGIKIVFVEYAEPEGAEAMCRGFVGTVYRIYKFNRVIPVKEISRDGQSYAFSVYLYSI